MSNIRDIKYKKYSSIAAQLAAVSQDKDAIKYIEHPTLEVQMAAVKNDGNSIKYISDPSEEIQLAAVQQDGTAIYYIKHPSLKVQLAAVQQDGDAIKYIQDPSLEVQLASVSRDPHSIKFIPHPSAQVQVTAVRCNRTAIVRIKKDQCLEVQIMIARDYPYLVIYLVEPRDEVLKILLDRWIKINYIEGIQSIIKNYKSFYNEYYNNLKDDEKLLMEFILI